jgi:hypothetical protein
MILNLEVDLKLGSLIHWAKTDCLELFEKIRPTLNCNKQVFNDDKKYESIKIDTPYLVPVVGTQYNESQKTFKEISDNFVNNNNIKSLVIKSKYGSGKTTYLKQLMEDQQYQRVLFITYRQTLARDIMRNFESLGFANYLDAYDKPRTWDSLS